MGVKRYTNEEWESGQADKSAARDKRLALWTYTMASLWVLLMLTISMIAISEMGRERFYELTGWPYGASILALLLMSWQLRRRYLCLDQQPMPPRWRW